MPHVLEVSTRPWLEELGVGSIGRVAMDELQRLGDMGYSWLWLMGVWQLGDYGRSLDLGTARAGGFSDLLPHLKEEDVIGSPYAIQVPYRLLKAHGYDCSQLPALRRRLGRVAVRGGQAAPPCPCSRGEAATEAAGMRLLLDFVPNHTAVDCEWILAHPLRYIRNIAAEPQAETDAAVTGPACVDAMARHGILHGGDGTYVWSDTLQLNYWNPELRAAMTEELLAIAEQCDGVRCDMAHLILNDVIEGNWGEQQALMGFSRPEKEFWEEAIAAVRERQPGFVFVAETYSHHSRLQDLGFDYTYDKNLYDVLSSFHLDNIRGYISCQGQAYLRRSCHFTANHDEARAVAHFGSWEKALTASWITFTVPGMRLHWKGEEEGRANRLGVHLLRALYEDPLAGAVEAYSAMLAVVSEPVFLRGSWEYLPVAGDDSSWMLMAWRWALAGDKRLFVANYSGGQGAGRVLLSNAEPDSGQRTLVVTELLSGAQYLRNVAALRTAGLWVVLPAWSVQVFRYP